MDRMRFAQNMEKKFAHAFTADTRPSSFLRMLLESLGMRLS